MAAGEDWGVSDPFAYPRGIWVDWSVSTETTAPDFKSPSIDEILASAKEAMALAEKHDREVAGIVLAMMKAEGGYDMFQRIPHDLRAFALDCFSRAMKREVHKIDPETFGSKERI